MRVFEIEEVDVILDDATNIESVTYCNGIWTITYKNDIPEDTFDTCQQMMEFLSEDGED